MMPKISILTATFNAVRHVEEAIRSVVTHDYANIEYIVVDGASNDGTVEIIRRYEEGIHRFISERDDGISDAFNKGVRLATGEIVGIVSADDALLPGALKAVAGSYVAHHQPDVIHGNVLTLDPSSGQLSVGRPDVTLRTAFFGQPLRHGATFVTKRAYDRYGLFDHKYKCAMDYDLILRMIVANARFAYVNCQLALIRSGGVSSRMRSLTRLESREISIKHGCPRWRAEWYYRSKIARDAAKIWLPRLGLGRIVSAHRRVTGRNVPI